MSNSVLFFFVHANPLFLLVQHISSNDRASIAAPRCLFPASSNLTCASDDRRRATHSCSTTTRLIKASHRTRTLPHSYALYTYGSNIYIHMEMTYRQSDRQRRRRDARTPPLTWLGAVPILAIRLSFEIQFSRFCALKPLGCGLVSIRHPFVRLVNQ